MPKLHLHISIDLEHMDDDIVAEAIQDITESLQYEFLEPITVTQLPDDFDPS